MEHFHLNGRVEAVKAKAGQVGPYVYARYKDVVIRSWKPEDAPHYHRVIGDAETMRFISGGKPRTLVDAQQEVAKFTLELQSRGWSRFAVSDGPDGDCVGYIGFAAKPDGIDFGGRCLRDFWGKAGYSTIACWLALDYGMSVVGFEQVYATIHVDNYRAQKMLEVLGFSVVGVIDTPIGPHNRLELTSGDYLDVIKHKNKTLIDRLFDRRRLSSTN